MRLDFRPNIVFPSGARRRAFQTSSLLLVYVSPSRLLLFLPLELPSHAKAQVFASTSPFGVPFPHFLPVCSRFPLPLPFPPMFRFVSPPYASSYLSFPVFHPCLHLFRLISLFEQSILGHRDASNFRATFPPTTASLASLSSKCQPMCSI